MRSSTNEAATEAAPMLEESSQLLAQKATIESKQVLLTAFSNHFILPDDEIAILEGGAEPIGDRFFQILRNVKRIHGDCQVLLASGNERVGAEIMDEMVKHLHSAFQKLFRWVQRELKTLSLETPQVSSGIRRALRVLAERPALFQSCLEFFAEARQKILLDSFYTAMTGNVPGSNTIDHSTNPIEAYAHDPLRYIGDMLAWLHSTAVGEQEALEVLFVSQECDEDARKNSMLGNIEERLKNEPWVGITDDGWDARAGLMSLVDKNLETVCRLLKARIEQAIASQGSSTLNYRLINLINFYCLTFRRILGDGSSLPTAINSLEETALRQFYHILNDHVRSVKADIQQPSADLSPPMFLHDSLKELHLLMKSYDTSLVAVEAREEGFVKILEHALDPYLEICEVLARELKLADEHIFSLNCLLAAKTTLELFDFTIKRVQRLREQIEQHGEVLTQLQHEFFLQASGLKSLLDALADWNSKVDHSSNPAPFTPATLQETSHKLDDFLPSALMDARASLKRLNSPRLIDGIIQKAAEAFTHDFARDRKSVV